MEAAWQTALLITAFTLMFIELSSNTATAFAKGAGCAYIYVHFINELSKSAVNIYNIAG